MTVPARAVSGRWVLDEADLAGMEVRRTARPMSARVGAALLAVISGEAATGLAASEVWRLRRRCERLLADPEPAGLLRAWMRDRPPAEDAGSHRSCTQFSLVLS